MRGQGCTCMHASIVSLTNGSITQTWLQVLPYPDSNLPNRTILNRHGVRLLIDQSGTLGVFSFQTTLVQLVSRYAGPHAVWLPLVLHVHSHCQHSSLHTQCRLAGSGPLGGGDTHDHGDAEQACLLTVQDCAGTNRRSKTKVSLLWCSSLSQRHLCCPGRQPTCIAWKSAVCPSTSCTTSA